MAAKRNPRPIQAVHQIDTTSTPLHESAQLIEAERPPRKNGFEFSNRKFIGFAACGSHPPVVNIPGFPFPPGLNPRSRRKAEKVAQRSGVAQTIAASLARAIKLVT